MSNGLAWFFAISYLIQSPVTAVLIGRFIRIGKGVNPDIVQEVPSTGTGKPQEDKSEGVVRDPSSQRPG